MKILVTNDDGIDAPGLRILAKELQSVGEVVIVAPHQEQSGVGSSISLHRAIRVKKLEPEPGGMEVYAVEGTPADSVIIALNYLLPGEIGLVVSGINRGPNIGHDVFVSGTVGAAMQGCLRGIPSLAISVNTYESSNFNGVKLASLLASRVKDGFLSGRILLNINLPDLALSEIGGVEVTELSDRSYCDLIQRDQGSEEEYYRIMRNGDSCDGRPGSDIWALKLNRISITPMLHSSAVNLLRYRLKGLVPVIYRELRKF